MVIFDSLTVVGDMLTLVGDMLTVVGDMLTGIFRFNCVHLSINLFLYSEIDLTEFKIEESCIIKQITYQQQNIKNISTKYLVWLVRIHCA